MKNEKWDLLNHSKGPFMFGVIDNIIVVNTKFYLLLTRLGKKTIFNRRFCLSLHMINIHTYEDITQISFSPQESKLA